MDCAYPLFFFFWFDGLRGCRGCECLGRSDLVKGLPTVDGRLEGEGLEGESWVVEISAMEFLTY
jgi:hypothetical protein